MRLNIENCARNGDEVAKAWALDELVRNLKEMRDRSNAGDMHAAVTEFFEVFRFSDNQTDPSPVRSAVQAAQPEAVGALPTVCDGKEQEAFEAFCVREKMTLSIHPIHYLFLDPKTDAARQAWKAALTYVGDVLASAPTEPMSAPTAEPVAEIGSFDEYGPCFNWFTHWTKFAVGTKFYAQQPANPRKADDVDLLLRAVFELCEATEEAPEVEPKNEHQRGFDKGRRFEAKAIRRSVGDWFQATFCGQSFMGEPVLTKPGVAHCIDGACHLCATPPSAATPEPSDAERPMKSLNALIADQLRPFLKPGEKVIWREAFRWHDDNGVMPNHYDGMSVSGLADEFGYRFDWDFNMNHAAIIQGATKGGKL